MKKLLHIMIQKWPLKIIFITLIAVAVTAIFVGEITLSTGNETLINVETDTYQENFMYQETFGTDPIMIVFNSDNQESLLSYESLSVINELVESIEELEGIFYINSPIGMIDYAVSMSYTNYQTALNELSFGLLTMSNTIRNMSMMDDSFDSQILFETFDTLATSQEVLSENFISQVDVFAGMSSTVLIEVTRLENIKNTLDPITDVETVQSLTQTIQILTSIDELYNQLILGNNNLAMGATQTAGALDAISGQLSTLFTTLASIETNIDALALNLETMGNTLSTLADNFNMFIPSFPSSSDTLDMMIYPEGVRNPMLDVFMIDETHMYTSIILKESVTNDNIEVILNTINETLEDGIHSDALVSGKPVLNYDIQSTMMDSMKIMMLSAGIIMVLILLILFPVKARLLPLLIVLLAVITTVGMMGLFSIPLTMVSMAVFPVLIGLGIDYSIQFHNRYMEEEMDGVSNE
ncbi:MAG: MMPL family transporter [Firmicutes bacterium]|nr:MMPL family transporter [Bacillota bacterium]